VISPIAVVVIYLFKEQFEVSKYYGIRSTDLVYFLLFSAFLVPALWVIDIFLFNLQELLWNWKLFEYIQFCNERFANRTRRWVGLDNTINEELPPDLRALDQMCLSVQFYLLGSLHCSGIVFAVLGYMLVLHQEHNLFGDPVVIPLFLVVSLFLTVSKIAAMKIADRFKIWMVEGEYEYVEVYDEGPGSRKAGALPPGMAAIDVAVAECIEDTFAAGYTEDHLIKLLMEAAAYVPAGMSIQAMGVGSSESGGAVVAGSTHDSQLGRGAFSTPASICPTDSRACSCSSACIPSHPGGLSVGELPFSGPRIAASFQKEQGLLLGEPNTTTRMSLNDTMGPGISALGAVAPAGHIPGRLPHLGTIPSAPLHSVPEGGETFSDFIHLFRKEMRLAKEHESRATKFVQSRAVHTITDVGGSVADTHAVVYPFVRESHYEEDDDYDYWPDFGLGVAQDDGQEGLSISTTSTTEGSTSEQRHDSSEVEEDLWPIELVVGAVNTPPTRSMPWRANS
jgi:hypothetical protein